MSRLSYTACTTLQQATAVLSAAENGTVLAGGTDLLIELRKERPVRPRMLVDIGRIDELKGMTIRDGTARIGPLVTHADLTRSALTGTPARFLCEAAALVGSPQIRNRGTIGGNIMNAATCADTVPALCALNARFTLTSSRGTREVHASGFFRKPYVTCAERDEILTAVTVPLPPSSARGSFIKLGRRNAVSISRLSVAALLTFAPDGSITGALIVPGSAFPVWQNVPEASAILAGRRPTPALCAEAGAAAAEAMIRVTGRRWSTEYKEPVLAVLVRRALERCCFPDQGAQS